MQILMNKVSRGASVRVNSVSGKKTVSGVSPTKKGTKEGGPGKEYALTLPGICDPFPDMFDPAGFANTASINDIRRWRESELTHGRVAMLAALGFVVGEQLEDFPAFLNFDGHITGPAIYQFQQVEARGAVFWEPLLLVIGLAESYRVSVGWASPKGSGFNALKDDSEYELGDLGFDPLGLKPSDPEELKILETKELNNGRLAMISVAGFVAAELKAPGTEVFEHLFLSIDKEVVAEAVDVEKDLGILSILPTIQLLH